MSEYPTVMARYGKFIMEYQAESRRYFGPRKVIWVFGQTGTGKTSTFADRFQGQCEFVTPKNGFFNGYTGKNFIIFDDLRHTDIDWNTLLQITDRFDTNVNVKGTYLPWNAKLIVITCPYPPDHFRSQRPDSDSNAQLLRRIHATYHLPDQIEEYRAKIDELFMEFIGE